MVDLIARAARLAWKDIKEGENVDIYVTALVAIGLAIVNLAGYESLALNNSITLAVLGLLAISSLVTRRKLDQFEERFAPPSRWLYRRPEIIPFVERGEKAAEIVVVGVSLVSVLT